jgi:predicted porin
MKVKVKTKLKLIALAVSAGVAMPGLASAVEVAGKALDIYGKAHLSLDAVSSKQANGSGGYDDVNNLSISSNSSRLGFKGEMPVGAVTGFYKIEAAITFDNGDGTSFSHRAAYAGVEDGFGSVLVGYRDTPLKDIRGMFDVFGDTVGDARNIFGSVSASNYADVRAKNAIMYTTPKMGGFAANVMYSTAWEGNDSNQNGQDNNNDSLESVNLIYKANKLVVGAAWQQQNYVDTTTTSPTFGDKNDTRTTTRAFGTYDFGQFQLGLMWEKMDDDSSAAQRRNAYGANFVINAGANGAVKFEYIVADDTDATSNSGATETAVGYDYKLDKHSSTYIMYSVVSNDTNATYLIGNGHDQKYTTAAGQDVSAVSVGYMISF